MTHGNTPFLTGTLELIVLQLLRAEPTNGYDLTLRIQAISNDVLNVNAGSESGRRVKVYSLSAAGRKQLAEQRASWERFSGALAAILAAGRLSGEETT